MDVAKSPEPGDLPDQTALWNAYGHAMGAASGLEMAMRIALLDAAKTRYANDPIRLEKTASKFLRLTFGGTIAKFKEVYPGFAGDPKFVDATSSGRLGSFAYQYDANGNRTRITHPDGFYAAYAYDGLNRPSTIKENGAATLVTFAYDPIGRRTGITRANGATTTTSYDPVSRLASLAQDFAGTASDATFGFAYNPAGQIVSRAVSNDALAFVAPAAVASYAVNGQNQLTAAAGATIGYDANGNLTSDGSTTFGYDAENRLVSATGVKNATLAYDPSGRLDTLTSGGATSYYGYDGPNRLIEAAATSGPVSRRYVFGPGEDEALAWYEGASTTDRRFLHADHQGSIIAISDASGAATSVNRYDEYGIPATTNVGATSASKVARRVASGP